MRRRYVAGGRQSYATTLTERLPWVNSALLAGDAADAVAKLKEQPGKDIGIHGSGELVSS